MNTDVLISVLLALGWIVASGFAVALLALAYTLGHRYIFTRSGISRLGPRIGHRLAATTLVHQGAKLSLRQLLAPRRLTLLVFVGLHGNERFQLSPTRTLAPDLVSFSELFGRSIKVVIFCEEPGGKFALTEGDDPLDILVLPRKQLDRLTHRLGFRIVPYALLVDERARVLAKGAVNHFGHLCWLVERGGESGIETQGVEWEAETQACKAHLETLHAHQSLTIRTGDRRQSASGRP